MNSSQLNTLEDHSSGSAAALISAYGISSNTQLEGFANNIGLPINEINYAEDITIDGDGAYIINLAERGRGTHWTGLWIENGSAFYFDSYGVGPEDILIEKLRGKVDSLSYNDKYEFQRFEEELCGMWVLMFLHYMRSGTGSLDSRFKKMKDRYVDTV